MSAAIAEKTNLIDELAGALPLTDAVHDREVFPPSRNGRSYHPLTVKRWSSDGVGPRKVKLKTVKFGGVLYVTRQAVREFFEALNESPDVSGDAAEQE